MKPFCRIWCQLLAVNLIKNNSDIRIEGLFILGLPGETYEDSLKTIRLSTTLPIHMAQYSICTPYPGSPLFEELKQSGQFDTGERPDGTVDTSVWKRYSSYIVFTDIEPIWITPTLTYAQVRKLQKKALRAFYLRPSQIALHIKRLRWGNLRNSIKIALDGFF